MSQRLPIHVRLDHFEGPLDLLLYLIQTHELDISKISITKITDQYLEYVTWMQELNFEIASEFLVLAATLLYWKSKALLPKEENLNANGENGEEEILSQEDLIRQLMEHQRFQKAGQDLNTLPRLNEDIFSRPNKRPPVEKVWKEMDVSNLMLTYQDVLVKSRKRSTVLRKETVSLADKIVDFASRLSLGQRELLADLIKDHKSRPEWVVTFLASLELARLKRLRVYQEGEAYTPIWLELIETLANFDTHLAIGFDDPAPPVAPSSQSSPTQTAPTETA